MKTLTTREFKRRVRANSSVLQTTYRTSADPAAFHLYDAQQGEIRPMMLLDKVYDIFAAVSIGALAVTARDGADAMMLRNGVIEPIELKFVKINSSRYRVGRQGGIYIAGQRHRKSLAQTIQAQYMINSAEHLKTKNRYTVMVIYDADTDQFVEARGIEGRVAVKKLSAQQGKQRIFHWNTFVDHGEIIELTVPALGYDNLQQLIRLNNMADR